MIEELEKLHPLVAGRILQMIGAPIYNKLPDAPTEEHRRLIVNSLWNSARKLPESTSAR